MNYQVKKVSMRLALCEDGFAYSGEKITNHEEAARFIQNELCDLPNEHIVAIAMNTKGKCIGYYSAGQGNLQSCIADPGAVFKPALLMNAHTIILAHNHPSGDVTPSSEDYSVTERMRECGELLGIRVCDHIIVGHGTDEVYSFFQDTDIFS